MNVLAWVMIGYGALMAGSGLVVFVLTAVGEWRRTLRDDWDPEQRAGRGRRGSGLSPRHGWGRGGRKG